MRTFTDRFAAVVPGGFVTGIGCACAFALQRALYEGCSLTDPALVEALLINMLVLGLIFGSAAGLILSRLLLPLTGKLPWSPEDFLDDAYRRGVLRRSGAVYQCRHVRLQHHLGHTYRRRQGNYTPATFPMPPR